MAGDPTIRPATPADIPSIRALLAAHDEDGPVDSVDIVGPYVRHLVAHGVARVAERRDEVVAYGAAIDTGIALHLADLFVRPDLLGHGIGRRLLESVLGAATPRSTFASADPRALALYVRAGMTPLWSSFYMEGSAARLAATDRPILIEPADPSRLATLERAWTGADRAADHAFWASQAQAEAFIVSEAGEPVGLAYARARQVDGARAVDRLVIRPGADPVGPMLAAIRHAGRGGPVAACVPGPSPILPSLLAAGFRIVDRDQFMASAPDLVDPARLLPNPGML